MKLNIYQKMKIDQDFAMLMFWSIVGLLLCIPLYSHNNDYYLEIGFGITCFYVFAMVLGFLYLHFAKIERLLGPGYYIENTKVKVIKTISSSPLLLFLWYILNVYEIIPDGINGLFLFGLIVGTLVQFIFGMLHVEKNHPIIPNELTNSKYIHNV